MPRISASLAGVDAIAAAAGLIKTASEQDPMADQFTLSSAAAQLRSADDIVSGNIGDRFDITFFVSCYNEEEFIIATLDTVQAAMMGLGLTYDIVVIDDGSKDRSPELVRSYIAEHPDLNIVFRCNAVNKGWAQNYIDSTFIGKGRYHRAICGDNSEMVSTIRAVLKPLGQADIIIPYYVEVEHKLLSTRRVVGLYLHRQLAERQFASLLQWAADSSTIQCHEVASRYARLRFKPTFCAALLVGRDVQRK